MQIKQYEKPRNQYFVEIEYKTEDGRTLKDRSKALPKATAYNEARAFNTRGIKACVKIEKKGL